MERLPDRNIEEERRIAAREAKKESGNENKTRAEKLRSNFSTYGVLILLVCVLFFLMADEAVPLEDIHVNEIRSAEDGTTLLVGQLSEQAGRYCKSQVNFNEASGTVEVTIRQYQVSTFLGTKDFIVPIEAEAEEIQSIWLVYDDGSGQRQREQLEYGSDKAAEAEEAAGEEEA